ncbi:MAG: ribonucleotide reductase alpha subunit, partial [Halobacteriales archaeon]
MSNTEPTADELTLPIKRTEGDTLEERLTDNAYHNILPARYLRKDADGELIETQEDLFERVAKNVALAEAVYEAERLDVEVTVTPDQLKPDHPRRDELAEEVFGPGVSVDADVETALTEEHVNKFAYETIVPELPDEIREDVKTTADEFQALMESLGFMPNCVPPDSLVASEGGLKPLTDIDPGERVYDDEDGDAHVESKFENGEKLVKEIETGSGYTVRATPEHYFRVVTTDGEYAWRQVKNLQPDDVLALQKNFLDDDGSPATLRPTGLTDGGMAVSKAETIGRPRTEIETPDEMTPALAEWIGFYVGDGTARETGIRVAFDEQDDDLVNYWQDLTASVFGFEPTTRRRNDAACVVGGANRRDLYEFLDRNDLLKDTSKTATVPRPVLESGRTPTASFLRGLFEADGTVNERSIELYTHSEALAGQVQKLLLGLGIRSTVTEKRGGYRVTVRKNVSGKHFVERIGFLSERKQERAGRFKTVSDNGTSVKIPHQTERLHEWFQESDLGLDAYRDLSQFLIDPESEYHQNIGVGIFRKYAEQYPELWGSPVAEFVKRDQFYEPVTEIRDIGRMAVEDMQVPRRNTYVVEGFVSHNSPTLMNAGDELQQLSACFVDSPEDDMEDIHETVKESAKTFQSGGGMGYAFWRLRPYGDPVGSTGGIASGPITFMRTFDQACETIAQGGARRGAQMAVMRVTHPDVIQFIHAKNKDVSLAQTLRLNDPDDFTHNSFADALEEARELIDDEGRVPEHLRNAVEGHLSNFNISVGITDDFMAAVQSGEEFTFTNPRTGEAHIATEQTKELYDMHDLGEYVEVGEELSVPADLLWEHIIEGAHENGEPGVIYLERVNKQHSFDVEEYPDHEILATNPSLAAGTKVLTDRGIVDIEQLEGDRVEVPTANGEWADAVCHRSGNDETLYEVELENGKTYLATEEHKWPVLQDGSYERTKTTDLEHGHHLPIKHRKSLRYGSVGNQDEGFLVGWLYGDGSITHRKDGRTQYGFTFSHDDVDAGVMERVLEALEDITGVEYNPTERQREGDSWYEVHASHAALRNKLSEYGVNKKSQGLPEVLWDEASESFRKGFVDGLFSADGFVDEEENRIVLVSSKEELIKDVSDLLGFYGLKTSLRQTEVEKWEETYDRYDLKLSRTAAHRFRETFTLTHETKAASLADLKTPDRENIRSDNIVVEAVRPAAESGPVWDLRVNEETHTFALSHAFTGNCGEQPLEEYEACNLGHINLSTVADSDAPDWRVWRDRHADEYDSIDAAVEAYLDEAIDWDELDERIELGTRFLENVVTMSDFPVEEIEKTVRRMRKIGMGVMGLAQLYVQLGVRYGSDEANEIARRVMRHINHRSKWASHELAQDRGSFDDWDESKYRNPTEYREWFEHHTGLHADEWADGFPIRNHNTTTVAPTGTTSMVGNTTGGIEPIYNV